MAGEWGDVLQALGLHTEDAPSNPLVSMGGQTPAQLAVVPEQRANMLLNALGPLGDAGMALGEMLRTRQFDSRMLPQIAGGVMLGTAAPGGLETGEIEAAAKNLVDLPASKAAQILFGTLPVEAHAPILAAMAKETSTTPEVIKQQLLDAGPRKAKFGDVPGAPGGGPPVLGPFGSAAMAYNKAYEPQYGLPAQPSLSDAAISAKLAANPGASIFDLAAPHVAGPSSAFTGSMPRIDFENIPRTGYPTAPLAARVLGRSENLAHGTSVAVPSWSVPEGNVSDIHSPSNQVGSYGDALALPDDEIGVHFGNPKQSGTFAQAPDSNARTYPVVVATNNPLRMRDLGSWHLDRIVNELQRLSSRAKGPNFGEFPDSELGNLDNIGDARKYLADKGYDSIVYKNSEEDPGYDSYIKFIPSPVAPDYVSGVRSPFAQFNPNKLSWPELAAGLAGVGAIPALAHEEGQQE